MENNKEKKRVKNKRRTEIKMEKDEREKIMETY